jgi:hypothetical protein
MSKRKTTTANPPNDPVAEIEKRLRSEAEAETERQQQILEANSTAYARQQKINDAYFEFHFAVRDFNRGDPSKFTPAFRALKATCATFKTEQLAERLDTIDLEDVQRTDCTTETIAMLAKGFVELAFAGELTETRLRNAPSLSSVFLTMGTILGAMTDNERLRLAPKQLPAIQEKTHRPKAESVRRIQGGNEDRDKWVYEQCCDPRKPLAGIVAALRRIGKDRGWALFTSKQRVQQIGKQYAERNGLNLPPPRREQ